MINWLRLFLLLLFAAPASAQQNEYRSTIHFGKQYENAARQFAFPKWQSKPFSQWQKAFRPELKKKLGLDLVESTLKNYKPVAVQGAVEDLGDFTREAWTIWTEPTVPLPVLVLIPKNKSGRLPLVLTPHGHGRSTVAYAGVYTDTAEQKISLRREADIAVQAVREGYIAIAPTTRAFGNTRAENDLKTDKPFSCRIQLMHDLLTGRTPIGDRVWDMSKILDWALRQFPVDEKHVAITGNSGGGTVSLFAAACDERFTLAMPSSYFSTFEGSIGVIEHCDCNYIPGILQLGNMSDIAGLIAPRPMSIIHGKEDDIYPIEETRKAFGELQLIYKAAGAADKLSLYEGEGGHRYYKAGAWPFARKYFLKK